MTEIWKDIENYKGLYQVSNLGRVKSLSRKDRFGRNFPEKIKTQYLRRGYLSVMLSNDGQETNITVHRIVATYFIPNPNGLPQVNHKNGDKKDNRIENLEWVSERENITHGYSRKVGKTSKYFGVSLERKRNRWKAHFHFDGKVKTFGYYKSEELAHQVVQNELIKLDIKNKYAHVANN